MTITPVQGSLTTLVRTQWVLHIHVILIYTLIKHSYTQLESFIARFINSSLIPGQTYLSIFNLALWYISLLTEEFMDIGLVDQRLAFSPTDVSFSFTFIPYIYISLSFSSHNLFSVFPWKSVLLFNILLFTTVCLFLCCYWEN